MLVTTHHRTIHADALNTEHTTVPKSTQLGTLVDSVLNPIKSPDRYFAKWKE